MESGNVTDEAAAGDDDAITPICELDPLNIANLPCYSWCLLVDAFSFSFSLTLGHTLCGCVVVSCITFWERVGRNSLMEYPW